MLSCHGSLIPRRACVIVLESAAFMRHIQYRDLGDKSGHCEPRVLKPLTFLE